MVILGVSANYHDSSAALIVDGAVVAAAAEERFTLQKHDPSFPAQAAAFCLGQAGLTAENLDLIAYFEIPEAKFSRTLATSFLGFPFSGKVFRKSMREAITSGLWVRNEISKELDIDPAKIVFVPHHLSHAAYSFFPSPFSSAAILTIDSVGEWTSTGLFRGDVRNGGIDAVDVFTFPHSIGLVYSAFTAFLGFRVNDGECSTMALAAFGEPRYADQVREILRVAPDGTYAVDTSYFDLQNFEGAPVTEKFVRAFGAPRAFRGELPFDCLSDSRKRAPDEDQRFADVAASVQCVLEEAVLALAKRAASETKEKNLCLGGGVALNCVANGKLAEAGIFENVFVPPDPGDGGCAAGAGLYAHWAATGRKNEGFAFHPYLGKGYEEASTLEMLPHLPAARGVRVAVRDDFSGVLARVIPALAEGKIVGWVQGRFENGPRALGNRSILCDPGRLDVARRLSARVKKRAAFRPYACSLADFESERVFTRNSALRGSAGKWMLSSASVCAEMRPRLRAALHVDGSTRPQICAESDNPRFFRLLQEYGAHTGLAALLNTSLNEAGMPLVSSPNEALLLFLRTEMDMLVLNNCVLVKEA